MSDAKSGVEIQYLDPDIEQYYKDVAERVLWVEGEITESNLRKLSAELGLLVRDNHDSVIIYKMRQEKWIDRIFIGNQEDKTDNFF